METPISKFREQAKIAKQAGNYVVMTANEAALLITEIDLRLAVLRERPPVTPYHAKAG
jgi:hypothetical protein